MLGGGGNVTFPGIGLSRGIPLSLILVCTSGHREVACSDGHGVACCSSEVVQLAGASDAPPGTRVSNRPVCGVILVIADV